MSKQLEIIATLGPTSKDKISDLIISGATAFRLNCSHINKEDLFEWLNRIDDAAHKTGVNIPIWLDLQGSKMRIGELYQPMLVNRDDRLTFIYGGVQEKDEIPLPHQEVFNSVEMGDKLYLDDGRIELEVEIVTDDDFLAKVIAGGKIQSFKGFSKAHYVDYQHEISEKDLSFIRQTYQYEQVGYAMSFIQSPEEVLLIRKHTRHKPLICKVERLRTFENLKSIAMYSNGMWLCRGDLGIEANIYNLYEFEKIFVQKLRTLGKPYLIAGQVLEHMVQNRQPSRSEVAHLGYLLEGGFNGVVLSDETAIGKFPAQVVKFCKNFFNHFQQLSEGQLN